MSKQDKKDNTENKEVRSPAEKKAAIEVKGKEHFIAWDKARLFRDKAVEAYKAPKASVIEDSIDYIECIGIPNISKVRKLDPKAKQARAKVMSAFIPLGMDCKAAPAKAFTNILLSLGWADDEPVLAPGMERSIIQNLYRQLSIVFSPNPVTSERIEVTKEQGVAVKKLISKIKTVDLVEQINHVTTIRENEITEPKK